MIGWGFYKRWACTSNNRYRIPIKIWKCKKVNRYISILPTFLLPYKQYTFSVIYTVLKLYILSGLSMEKSLAQVFSKSCSPAYQLVQYWIKGISKKCSIWTAMLQQDNKLNMKPSVNKSSRPQELIQLMEAMEYYFQHTQVDAQREAMHEKLFNRYRGSPFSKSA